MIAIESFLETKFISDVLYVQETNQNLLSFGQLMEKGYKVYFLKIKLFDKRCTK